jgi:hypothetical protein
MPARRGIRCKYLASTSQRAMILIPSTFDSVIACKTAAGRFVLSIAIGHFVFDTNGPHRPDGA